MENSFKNSSLIFNEEFRTPDTSAISLRKSILKPCSLRRSMSMESQEGQKKVAFCSPRRQLVVDVSYIDEKMKKSYIEDKNDLGHRQRSFTVPVNFPHKNTVKSVPNFRAIHEQEFKKMESLADHAQRKAERAKKLLAPSRLSVPTPSMIPKLESSFVRNSETRIPIKRPAANVFIGPPNKIHKTSSIPISDKDRRNSLINAVNFVKKESPISKIISKFTGNDKKVQPERPQLKGVRLNKRFELQMKHNQLNPQQGRS